VANDSNDEAAPLEYPHLLEVKRKRDLVVEEGPEGANQRPRNTKRRMISALPSHNETTLGELDWTTIQIPESFTPVRKGKKGLARERREGKVKPILYEWLHMNSFARLLDTKNPSIDFNRSSTSKLG
jgi:hypothetical protein